METKDLDSSSRFLAAWSNMVIYIRSFTSLDFHTSSSNPTHVRLVQLAAQNHNRTAPLVVEEEARTPLFSVSIQQPIYSLVLLITISVLAHGDVQMGGAIVDNLSFRHAVDVLAE